MIPSFTAARRLSGLALTRASAEGCVLFPALFSVFFAVVLTVTFDRFSINRAGAKDLIHIPRRGARTGGELSKAPWAMLYADDALIASRSQ